jgi:shikimate dehydrogenase
MPQHPPITGTTRLFAIIGEPIAQVRSPEVFAALFADRGIDAVMVPMRVAPADLETALAGLAAIANLEGLIATVPHKIACARLARALGPVAQLAGGANALRRHPQGGFEGEMFDGIGFVAALRAAGEEPAGKQVLVVGAGGVGSAIAAALLREGPARLTLVDVARERAQALAGRLQAAAGATAVEVAGAPEPEGFEIVVNATPLGMGADDRLPLDPERVDRSALVADVIMKPPRTRLLERAAARGCRVLEGRHMLDRQAPLIADYFGLRPRRAEGS